MSPSLHHLLTSLRLIDWRSHRRWTGDIARRTLFFGANGSGKTNILDAVSTLFNAKIPSEYPIASCVSDNATQALVTGDMAVDERILRCHGTVEPDKKAIRMSINGSAVTRPEYLRQIACRAIRFDPIELNTLYLDPGLRRHLLDTTVSLAYPAFTSLQSEYTRALRSRNIFLKDIKDGKRRADDLSAWDAAFVSRAVTYYERRLDCVRYIQEHLQSIESLLGRYRLTCEYMTRIDTNRIGESIFAYLADHREKDIVTGCTHIGPHLDDLHLSVQTTRGAIPAVDYLSRGECKLLFLGLKYAQIDYVEERTGSETIILLDDIGSELDDGYTRLVLDRCGDRQTLATTQTVRDGVSPWDGFERREIRRDGE